MKRDTSEWRPVGKTFWVCWDENNGHKGSKRYLWWFDTKKEAVEFLKEHRKHATYADLSDPVKVKLEV